MVQMKTTVKNISDTKVEATISLGESELADARLVALKKLSKEVKIDGFRKGHAPIEVVAKNVAPDALAQQILEEALSKGVADAFATGNTEIYIVIKNVRADRTVF